MLYETHMHTPLCRHAEGEPGEYAAVAFQRGLTGIVVTCHGPMPRGFSPSIRMSLDELDEYRAIVEKARREWEGRVDVRLGLECDHFPGYESFVEELTRSAPFEYLLGSVHPHTSEYARAFWKGDVVQFQKTYFTLLAEAAETGLFDCIAHPDLIKNSFPGDWRPERILDHIRGSLDRIAATGTAMELNTSGVEKSLPEFNPGEAILREMRARDIPVVVGADAHVPERVAADFEAALDMLAAVGYTHVSVFLERRRRDLPIEGARASLRQRTGTGG